MSVRESSRVGGVATSDSEPDPGGLRHLGPVPALDGYRGLAVLLVLVVHTQEITLPDATGIALLDGFIRAGFLGVDLFFVLSGFLITALLSNELDRTKRVAYGGFYARRGLRLLPALYCFLLAHLAFALASGMDLDQEFTSLWAALFYVSNWQISFAPETTVHHFSHLWSLAVEEQFYLVWPFVVVGFLGPRQSARTIAGILVPVIVLVVLWRTWLFGQYRWFELIQRTDTRVDQLLIGALMALLWTRRRVPRRGLVPAAWAASAVLLAMMFTSETDERFLFAGGMTVFALGAGVVVLALVEGEWIGRRVFELRPIRAVGRVSYGVYLWHMPIFFVCARADALPVGLRLVLAVVVTAAVVVFSWRFVEQPALRLQERFRSRGRDTRPGDRPAPNSLRRSLIAVAALVAAAGITGHLVGVDDGRIANDRFVAGDTDRSLFWAYAGLETVAKDAFDEEDAGLGSADPGGDWTSVAGLWHRVAGQVAVSGDPVQVAIAVLPGAPGDNGLSEVTLTTVQPGAGLVFRYRDAANFWSTTVAPDGESWIVVRVTDGISSVVGEITVTPVDGVTVTAVQNGASFRILIDGIDRYARFDRHLEDRLQAGLILRGAGDGEARWDRFLLMQAEG